MPQWYSTTTSTYTIGQSYAPKITPPYGEIATAHFKVLGVEPVGHYLSRVSPKRAQLISLDKEEFEQWDMAWEVDAGVTDTAIEVDRLSNEERIMLLHLVPWGKREEPVHDPSTHFSMEYVPAPVYQNYHQDFQNDTIFFNYPQPRIQNQPAPDAVPIQVDRQMPNGVVLRDEFNVRVNAQTRRYIARMNMPGRG